MRTVPKRCQIKDLIYPVNGYRGQLVEKGKKPKDHHKDNLELIKKKHQDYVDKSVNEKLEKKESSLFNE